MSTTTTVPQTTTTTWNLDPAHSVAEFKVKHMMISNVKGQFRESIGNIDAGSVEPGKLEDRSFD